MKEKKKQVAHKGKKKMELMADEFRSESQERLF